MLDGSNYDWWNVTMIDFLKSMDNKALKAVLKGWKHHIVKVIDKDGKEIETETIKPKEDWDEMIIRKPLEIPRL